MKELLGTWKLISCEAISTTNEVERVFGDTPYGRIQYEEPNRMAVIISESEQTSRSPITYQNPDEDIVFLSYSGTFEVTPEESKVVHTIQTTNIINWEGTEQERYFSIEGDLLTIRTAPYMRLEKEWVSTLKWRKE